MSPFNKNNKGQLFSTDLLFGSTVFLFILSLVILTSNQFFDQWFLWKQDRLRNETAQNISNALLYNTGQPADWENQTDLNGITSIGLAKNRNELATKKVQKIGELSSEHYDAVKDLLAASQYEIHVTIRELQSGNAIASFGQEPAYGKPVSAVTRIARYNEQTALIQVKVSEK